MLDFIRWRFGQIVSVAATVWLVGGCTEVHLYNAGKDKMASATMTTFKEVNLTEAIEVERGNQAVVTQKEIALARRNAEVRGDLRLLNIVDTEQPIAMTIWDSMDERLTALGIVENKEKKLSQNAVLFTAGRLLEVNETIDAVESRAQLIFALMGVEPVSCLPTYDTLPEAKNYEEAVAREDRENFAVIYKDYVDKCAEVKKRLDKFGDSLLSESVITKAITDWKQEEINLEQERAKAREAILAFKEAENAWKAGVEKNTRGDTEKTLKDAASKLKDAIKVLDGVGNLVSVRFLAKAQLDALNRLLEAAATGEDPNSTKEGEDLKRAAIVAASIPKLGKDVQAILDAGRRVPTSKLTLLRQRAELDLSYAKKRVERAEELVQLKRRQWQALVAEAAYFREARGQLCDLVKIVAGHKEIVCETLEPLLDKNHTGQGCLYKLKNDDPFIVASAKKCPLMWPLRKVLGPDMKSVDARKAVYLAVAYSVNAARVAEADQGEYAYREFALDGQKALDADDYAVKLWNALIATPVNSLVEYHASGVRPEEIAHIIVTGAGLGAIAGKQ